MISYTVSNFYDDMLLLYQSVNDKPFNSVTLPIEMKPFGTLLEGVFKQNFISYKEVKPVKLSLTNNIGVAFSGGKDSAALAVHLRNKGYTVSLWYISGMNKAYPDEKKFVKNFGEKYGFSVYNLKVDAVVKRGAFVENIVKNNLIISHILRRGFTFGLTNVALGCAFMNTEMLKDFGFSDSNQNLGTFADCVGELFGCGVFVREMESEALSYLTLYKEGVSFNDVVSCMMPLRYRGNLHKKNKDKGVVIRYGGCGGCYKCAMDYFYLESLGLLEYSVFSYKHYAGVLVRYWNHVFMNKPKNMYEYLSGFLNKKYIDLELVFNRMKEAGVDIYADI